MFGLSIKEKLYTAISNLSEQKIADVKEDLRDFCNYFDSASDEKREREYCRIIGIHSNAVSAALAENMSSGIMYKVGFAIQSPHLTGLPDEIDLDYLLNSGPKVGFYFAFYYYAITGKQINLDDYGKYIRPLNKRQLDLLTRVINSIKNERPQTNKRTHYDDTYLQFVDQISNKIGIDRDIAEEVANIVLFPPSRNEIYNRIDNLEKTIINKYGASGLPLKLGGIIGILLGNNTISKQDSDELLQKIQKKTIELLTVKKQ